MTRLHDVFESRVSHPFIESHFELTKNGKQISGYKDAFLGRRCFLIGNGPSLKAEDLTLLSEKGEISFAFNRVFNIFKETSWRPSFYISVDVKMLKGSVNEVRNLDLPMKLIPLQFAWYHGIQIEDAKYFNMKYQVTQEMMPSMFSTDASRVIYSGNTCMYVAAQFACYMGFKEIFLIGVDHHFRVSQSNDGSIIVDPSAKDYFSDSYNVDKDDLYIPNTEKSTLTYVAMQKFCNQMGVTVKNATRGGRLEVFPRVSFDDLFDKGSE